jgi:hypothetical protein
MHSEKEIANWRLDPRRAIAARWNLERLFKEPDLVQRLQRERYDLAWAALKPRRVRSALFKALEESREVQAELAARHGLLKLVPKEEA